MLLDMAKSLQAQRYRHLPAFLREMRLRASLTQRELAKRLRLSHTMIHSSETAERRVDIAEFADWAIACGIEPLDAMKEFLSRRKG